ncbi:MAG: hypothetical protein Q9216_004679 [Gyalolechia sp. 2 TL-2023]
MSTSQSTSQPTLAEVRQVKRDLAESKSRAKSWEQKYLQEREQRRAEEQKDHEDRSEFYVLSDRLASCHKSIEKELDQCEKLRREVRVLKIENQNYRQEIRVLEDENKKLQLKAEKGRAADENVAGEQVASASKMSEASQKKNVSIASRSTGIPRPGTSSSTQRPPVFGQAGSAKEGREIPHRSRLQGDQVVDSAAPPDNRNGDRPLSRVSQIHYPRTGHTGEVEKNTDNEQNAISSIGQPSRSTEVSMSSRSRRMSSRSIRIFQHSLQLQSLLNSDERARAAHNNEGRQASASDEPQRLDQLHSPDTHDESPSNVKSESSIINDEQLSSRISDGHEYTQGSNEERHHTFATPKQAQAPFYDKEKPSLSEDGPNINIDDARDRASVDNRQHQVLDLNRPEQACDGDGQRVDDDYKEKTLLAHRRPTPLKDEQARAPEEGKVEQRRIYHAQRQVSSINGEGEPSPSNDAQEEIPTSRYQEHSPKYNAQDEPFRNSIQEHPPGFDAHPNDQVQEHCHSHVAPEQVHLQDACLDREQQQTLLSKEQHQNFLTDKQQRRLTTEKQAQSPDQDDHQEDSTNHKRSLLVGDKRTRQPSIDHTQRGESISDEQHQAFINAEPTQADLSNEQMHVHLAEQQQTPINDEEGWDPFASEHGGPPPVLGSTLDTLAPEVKRYHTRIQQLRKSRVKGVDDLANIVKNITTMRLKLDWRWQENKNSRRIAHQSKRTDPRMDYETRALFDQPKHSGTYPDRRGHPSKNCFDEVDDEIDKIKHMLDDLVNSIYTLRSLHANLVEYSSKLVIHQLRLVFYLKIEDGPISRAEKSQYALIIRESLCSIHDGCRGIGERIPALEQRVESFYQKACETFTDLMTDKYEMTLLREREICLEG